MTKKKRRCLRCRKWTTDGYLCKVCQAHNRRISSGVAFDLGGAPDTPELGDFTEVKEAVERVEAEYLAMRRGLTNGWK